MKTTSPKPTVSLFGIICTTIGHDYVETRKVTDHISEYKCSHCGREVSDNLAGNLEVLTYEIKKINSTVSTFLEKRSHRFSAQSI